MFMHASNGHLCYCMMSPAPTAHLRKKCDRDRWTALAVHSEDIMKTVQCCNGQVRMLQPYEGLQFGHDATLQHLPDSALHSTSHLQGSSVQTWRIVRCHAQHTLNMLVDGPITQTSLIWLSALLALNMESRKTYLLSCQQLQEGDAQDKQLH